MKDSDGRKSSEKANESKLTKKSTLSLDIGDGLNMNSFSPEERTPHDRGRSVSPGRKRSPSYDDYRERKRVR
jgi:hypothetical protein